MRQPLTGNPLFRLAARAGAVANAVPAPLNGEQSLASGAMSSAGPLIVRIQLLPHLGSEPAAIELARAKELRRFRQIVQGLTVRQAVNERPLFAHSRLSSVRT